VGGPGVTRTSPAEGVDGEHYRLLGHTHRLAPVRLEAQLVSAALTALPAAPHLARPVLRELVRTRQLVTVKTVFEDIIRWSPDSENEGAGGG
jgi:hypothetical protein